MSQNTERHQATHERKSMTEKSTPAVSYLTWTGIALIVFGAFAVAVPAFAGELAVMVIGAVVLISGIMQFVQGLREESWSSKLLSLVLGVITAFCGGAILAHPLVGMVVLTLVLAVMFVIEGIWKIIASFSFRPAPGWLALLFSGILGFLLGFMIWKQWPLSGLWAVGILIGVDLLVTGCSMVALAMTIKRVKGFVEEAASG
jgi:uncharacterized membrane protein HdeD (DUF308 family)